MLLRLRSKETRILQQHHDSSPTVPSSPLSDHDPSKHATKKTCTLLYCRKKLHSVIARLTYVTVYYRFKTIILFGLLQMYMLCNMQGITKIN